MRSIGRFVVRHRHGVMLLWVALGVVAAYHAARVGDVLRLDDPATAVTESARAQELIHRSFDRPLAKLLAVTVSGPVPVDSAPFPELIAALSKAAVEQPYVAQALSQPTIRDPRFVSRDGRETFLVAVIPPEHAAQLTLRVPEFREALASVVSDHPASEGFEVHVTGEAALEWDARAVSIADARRLERIALLPASLVLVLSFGGLVAAALPVAVGVFAITGALAGVSLVGGFLPTAAYVVPIVTMVGLGVGIDYSLLMVTRFREELGNGLPAREAAERSARTAGTAAAVSGCTVGVGFGALLLAPSSEIRSVGVGGLLVVAVAVLLATTLLPALLATLGTHIDRPRWLAARLAGIHRASLWSRWGGLIMRRRWAALLAGLAVMAVITWPVTRLHIGVPRQGWFPAATESASGVEALDRIGARGNLLPVRVVLRAPEGRRIIGLDYLPGLTRLTGVLLADPRVAEVRGPVSLRGGASLLEYAFLYGDLSLARARYPQTVPAYVSADGRTALMDVVLTDTASVATGTDVVRAIRARGQRGMDGLDDVEIHVGGFAAAQVDEEASLKRAFPAMVALVVGATALMLLAAFRSVLVPVKAVIMNGLSVAGAFGLLVLVFQQGVGSGLFRLEEPTGATLIQVLVLVFAVAFGLSMDYEVFLLSRMKEAFDRSDDNDAATAEGLARTASVIASAAAIMIIVFGTFAFSRILIAQLLGFGLAMAVLLDATVVRLVMVPAFMRVAGKWNWWPGRRRPQE